MLICRRNRAAKGEWPAWKQHQQTESMCFGALSHFIPGKLLLVACHSKTSQRRFRKAEIILCMAEIRSQCLPAACPPLFHAHPLSLAVRESPSAGVITPASLPRQWCPIKTPLPQLHKTPSQLPCTPSGVNGDTGFHGWSPHSWRLAEY